METKRKTVSSAGRLNREHRLSKDGSTGIRPSHHLVPKANLRSSPGCSSHQKQWIPL